MYFKKNRCVQHSKAVIMSQQSKKRRNTELLNNIFCICFWFIVKISCSQTF